MLTAILLAVLIVLFLVAVVLAARTWKAATIVTVVALFIGTVTLMMLSAITLQTHAAWREAARDLKNRRDEMQATQDRLRNGAFAEVPADDMKDGVRQMTQRRNHILQDRGRLWHGTGRIAADGKATVTFVKPATQPVTKDLVLHVMDQFTKDLVLYVFESKDGGGLVGEFKVAGVDPAKAEVTLEPTLAPVDDVEKKRLAGKDGAWMLYEIMPVDSHDAFNELRDSEAAADKAAFAALLPKADAALFADPNVEHPALVAEYQKDGAETAEDGPTTWWRVTMKETTRASAVVDELPKPDGSTTREMLTLKQGREYLVDSKTAAELIGKKQVENADEPAKIKKIYVRPLRRYEYVLHDLHRQRALMLDRLSQTLAQQAGVVKAHAEAQADVKGREDENVKLKSDHEKMTADLGVIKDYLAAAEKQHADLKSQVAAAYQKNNQLAADLTRQQLEAAKRIGEQTASAAN